MVHYELPAVCGSIVLRTKLSERVYSNVRVSPRGSRGIPGTGSDPEVSEDAEGLVGARGRKRAGGRGVERDV